MGSVDFDRNQNDILTTKYRKNNHLVKMSMVRKVMLSKVYYNQMEFSCKLMIIWTLKVFLR